ncbi:MAG: hypothetical protein QG557_684 [Pseudomonadota bacterium]|nr:hypothetical protein [Pseudomonadota bacterium]
MVEGARLESVYTATYRGFESLTLRQIKSKAANRQDLAAFLLPTSVRVTIYTFQLLLHYKDKKALNSLII